MKALRFILMLFALLPISFLQSQTQTEMNLETENSYQKAEDELNKTYQNILSDYKSDTVFIKNLKASQQIWITFRDAELKMKYPERERGYYGSVQPMCIAIYLEQLTQERMKTLKGWVDGIEEGDVCMGSVKIK